MLKTKLTLILFFVTITSCCFCQSNNWALKYKWINNKDVKYTIVRSGFKIIDSTTAIPGKNLVQVKLSKKQQRKLQLINNEDWIKLLEIPEKDWATNLLLYCMNKKDGSQFISLIKNRDDWVKFAKAEDTKYWIDLLSKR